MALSSQVLLNNYAQLLGNVDELEKQIVAEKEKTLKLLRDIKSGECGIEDVLVTDNGWEIKSKPKIDLGKKDK